MNSNMAQVLNRVTIEDIQALLDNTIANIRGRKVGSGILFFDVSYLYNFYIKDMPFIKRYNLHLRYCQADVSILEEQGLTDTKDYRIAIHDNKKYLYEWIAMLETWFDGGSVHGIKPKKIVRKLDRVVNEGLEIVAKALMGATSNLFKYHAIGEGEDLEQALPSDTTLVDEINRIDVTKTTEGGSLSREGSTLYIVGNHPASLGSAEITETGVFDSSNKSIDKMLDHSVFDDPIDHDQFEDSAGSTTVIYMCGM